MNTFKGKICAKHPELQGGRYADGKCSGCRVDLNSRYRSANKERMSALGKRWRAANKVRKASLDKAWRDANKGRVATNLNGWYQKNKAAMIERAECWRRANRHKTAARESRRRAAHVNAMPGWADKSKMEEFYYTAKMLGMHTGEWYAVDHIVPLRSKLVCGLHVEHNFQVLTRIANIKKSNRVWPDMPVHS